MENYENGISLFSGKKGSNIYFIHRKKGVIIDTGSPCEGLKNLQTLQNANLHSDDVAYIINTHSHPDHVGANLELLTYFPNAQIINSYQTCSYQKKRRNYALYADIEDSFQPYPIHIEAIDNFHLDLGDGTLVFHDAPGHSLDSIVIELDNQFLFSGDAIYPNIIPQVDYYEDLPVSLHHLEETYRKLETKNYQRIFPGHGSPFCNLQKYYPLWMRKIQKFMSNPLLLLVNSICPLLELFIQKQPGTNKEKTVEIFCEYLQRPVSAGLWPTFLHFDFHETIEKALFLMKTLNMITINENDELFLTGELNQHLR